MQNHRCYFYLGLATRSTMELSNEESFRDLGNSMGTYLGVSMPFGTIG